MTKIQEGVAKALKLPGLELRNDSLAIHDDAALDVAKDLIPALEAQGLKIVSAEQAQLLDSIMANVPDNLTLYDSQFIWQMSNSGERVKCLSHASEPDTWFENLKTSSIRILLRAKERYRASVT